MAAQLNTVFQELRRVVLMQDGAGLSDGQLLEMFISQKDQAAFEALVRRYSSMVMKVCRRVLGNHHDAEDVFQTTFLVLARKASSIRPREMVANWLHGVAFHSALNARKLRTRRWGWEKQVAEMPEAVQREPGPDLHSMLDQEVNRLAEVYRLPILLCDLEGKSIKKVAQQLGWPQGTVAGRLARGRVLLAKRLARHGLAITGGVLVLQNSASACVSPFLVASTVKAASAIASGKSAATGLISANVAILMKGALSAMSFTKLKITAAVLVVGVMVGIGGGVLSRSTITAAQTGGELRSDGKEKQIAAALTDELPATGDKEQGGDRIDPKNIIVLYKGRICLLALKQVPKRIQIGDNKIVDHTQINSKQISLFGIQVGSTSLVLWFEDPMDKTKENVDSIVVRVVPTPDATNPATDQIDPKKIFTLYKGHIRLLDLEQVPRRIQIGDDKIVDCTLVNPKQIALVGRQLGVTDLNIWFTDPVDKTKENVISYVVQVVPTDQPQPPAKNPKAASEPIDVLKDLELEKPVAQDVPPIPPAPARYQFLFDVFEVGESGEKRMGNPRLSNQEGAQSYFFVGEEVVMQSRKPLPRVDVRTAPPKPIPLAGIACTVSVTKMNDGRLRLDLQVEKYGKNGDKKDELRVQGTSLRTIKVINLGEKMSFDLEGSEKKGTRIELTVLSITEPPAIPGLKRSTPKP